MKKFGLRSLLVYTFSIIILFYIKNLIEKDDLSKTYKGYLIIIFIFFAWDFFNFRIIVVSKDTLTIKKGLNPFVKEKNFFNTDITLVSFKSWGHGGISTMSVFSANNEVYNISILITLWEQKKLIKTLIKNGVNAENFYENFNK